VALPDMPMFLPGLALSSFLDGRYWARSSDPQLVDMEQPFAPVRSGALTQRR
jgi:hypothetical protein